MADEWPLRTSLELGALPSAVGCARFHVRQVLWEWGLTQFSERVELLISELLTNAVKASRVLEWTTPVRFWMLSDEASVLLLVWDGNPQPPVRIDTGELNEHGRGLLLVEALSDQWSWYVPPELGGKVVSALVTGGLAHDS
jgi:anti-sigma regulatory factor (Ser/Thr protein kinase)